MASPITALLIRDWFDPEVEIKGKRILEVGSASWPWESIKERFKGCQEYISIDLKQKFETDFICNAENLVEFFGAERFEVVISLFTLEHVENWKKVITNLKNVCSPGGVIFISSCTQYYPYHDSFDAWRFELKDFEEIFSDCQIENLAEFPPDKEHIPGSQVFLKVRKPKTFAERSLEQLTLFNINHRCRI